MKRLAAAAPPNSGLAARHSGCRVFASATDGRSVSSAHPMVAFASSMLL
jgi:hypothetical protein